MNRLKNIVVGVDFSPHSRNALKQAARIAGWNEAKLRLVHVVESELAKDLAAHSGRDVEEVRADLTERARNALKKMGDDLNSESKIAQRVLYGHATDEVVKQVKEVNAGLLVAGVRGLMDDTSGTGAQATRLVRSVPSNVLLVDDQHQGAYRRIVAGIDFSPTAKEVAAQALQIAEQDGCEVLFAHVYAAPWHGLHLPNADEYAPGFRASYLTDRDAELREFVGDINGVRASFHLHQNQKHGRGISEFARQQAADLVVVGTRGRFNIRYILLGSTAEYVLSEQPCSVLAIRPPESPERQP